MRRERAKKVLISLGAIIIVLVVVFGSIFIYESIRRRQIEEAELEKKLNLPPRLTDEEIIEQFKKRLDSSFFSLMVGVVSLEWINTATEREKAIFDFVGFEELAERLDELIERVSQEGDQFYFIVKEDKLERVKKLIQYFEFVEQIEVEKKPRERYASYEIWYWKPEWKE